jgi:hypothetical protein
MFGGDHEQYYTPSEWCTIDEQLLGFRGHCPNKICIQNKTHSYEIKMMTLCDARAFCMVDAMPYTGKVQKEASESIPGYCV